MDRTQRIAEEMRRVLSDIIRNDIKDPRIPIVTSITNIKLAKDLKYAKVYVSILNAKSVKEDLAILKKSSGLTRSLLARRMNLRITPEVIFELDDSMEYGSKMEQLIEQVSAKDRENSEINK